jgi:Asp-tRNA(Asn)/Glu-tRNA(Gln) amidotransferase C subunit
VEENQTAKKIAEIEKVFSSMGRILDVLGKMTEIELTNDVKSKINGNIDSIFEYIQEICVKVDNLMNPTDAFFIANDKRKAANVIKNNISEYAEQLGSVGQVFQTISDILDALDRIKDIKFTQKDADNISKSLEFLFAAVEYVVNTTNDKLEELGGISIDTEALDIVIQGVTDITDVIETLNEVSIDNFKVTARHTIDFLVKLAEVKLDTAKADAITRSLDSLSNFIYRHNATFIMAEARLKFMERVNQVVKSLGDVIPQQIERSKEMIKHQIAYLDKVNNIDISKLKTSARMVESMAKLSKSIRGNFEGLAESINEDLMPVLKELKEIMEKIPEKLDTGFENTSASIGALNAPPSQEGFAAQIRRENPRLSSEQNEAAAKSRMVAAASRLSGNRTITDLYNLFAGDIAGTRAKVKIG